MIQLIPRRGYSSVNKGGNVEGIKGKDKDKNTKDVIKDKLHTIKDTTKEKAADMIASFQSVRPGADAYQVPKYPIILCHGLLGFDSIKMTPFLPKFKVPSISYWRGIKELLNLKGMQVYSATVAPTASIETRAHYLEKSILQQAIIPVVGGDSTGDGGENAIVIAKTTNDEGNNSDSIKSNTHVPSKLSFNMIGHSMGGLDARYYISKILPKYNELARHGTPDQIQEFLQSYGVQDNKIQVLPEIEVKSLTTISTPHRGSYFADHFLESFLSPERVPRVYKGLGWVLRLVGYQYQEGLCKDDKDAVGAFQQLTRRYMKESFNPQVRNDPNVEYFSYAARFEPKWYHLGSVSLLSPLNAFLYHGWKIVEPVEGPNDGLVSVESAKWGCFLGTIRGVNHVDLINWINSFDMWKARVLRYQPPFSAAAFYLDVIDRLAKRGF